MKSTFNKLVLSLQGLDMRHVRVAFALLALVLLVLGAGAPDDGGHIAH